jgi:hypothetical protein
VKVVQFLVHISDVSRVKSFSKDYVAMLRSLNTSSTPLALPYFLYLSRNRRDVVSLALLSHKAREHYLLHIPGKGGDSMFSVFVS